MTYVGNHVGGDEESKGGASSATTNAYIIISTHPIKGGNLSLFISKVRPERYPMIEEDTPPPCWYLLHLLHLHRRPPPPGIVLFTREH